MADDRARPILVTGSHRSGSTWVGKVLVRSGQAAYLDEPFHLDHRRGVCAARFENWFQYICEENEGEWVEELQRALSFRYGVLAELPTIRSPRDLGRMVRDWRRFARNRAGRLRPLIKDPIAFFSSPWIARRFDADVVILIRHPAAFASSLLRLDWTFDFRNLTRQPLLMGDLLEEYRAEIESFAAEPRELLEQAALLWRMIYGVAARWQQEHSSWCFVRHEDLSLRPEQEFGELFGRLGLDFTPEARTYLDQTTSRANPAEAPRDVAHVLNRDSRSNVWNWATRLDPEQIESLRSRVEPVSRLFYDDADWIPEVP